MDAELKAKWVAALRSGEFRQAQKCLSNGRAYCCLGVLAIVHDPSTDLRENEGEFNPYYEIDKMIGGLSVRQTLVNLNDKHDKSFPEIADWVEQNIASQ